jgi:hypothetical protein
MIFNCTSTGILFDYLIEYIDIHYELFRNVIMKSPQRGIFLIQCIVEELKTLGKFINYMHLDKMNV